jgi:hypothetical protein
LLGVGRAAGLPIRYDKSGHCARVTHVPMCAGRWTPASAPAGGRAREPAECDDEHHGATGERGRDVVGEGGRRELDQARGLGAIADGYRAIAARKSLKVIVVA